MITIAQRYRPFSHLPGSRCLIPGTGYVVEAYPTLIRIKDLKGTLIKEVLIDVQGPLKQFTQVQDLERGCVTLLSELYTLHVLPTLEISFQKNPPLPPLISKERLSLGSHKKQEWQGIRQRLDFREIFPLWFRLGSLLSLPPSVEEHRGTFSLLQQCRAACVAHRPEWIIPAFERLFLCGFGHLLVPRTMDEDYHGILKSHELPSLDPLYLLSEGAALIRSLFLMNEGHEITILPNLPPEFFAGRMVNLMTPPYGSIDLEWSKKTIRRLQFHATTTGEILLHFRPSITQYRLRQNREERGRVCANGESLVIKSGSHYLLDQFQK